MIRVTMRRLGSLVGALALLPGTLVATRGDALAQGCAMCRTALGDADDPLARGFYWSVLFLMSAPYIVAGAMGAWLAYRISVRRLPEAGLVTDPIVCDEQHATLGEQREQGRDRS
jgi:hypothetical protein